MKTSAEVPRAAVGGSGAVPDAVADAGCDASSDVGALPGAGAPASEEQTRHAVARRVLEQGPVSASAVAGALGLGAAGVRRHLDALSASGEATCASAPSRGPRGRGRPARSWVLTETGRARFGHAYDDLAAAALRQLREVAGDGAVLEFARRRARSVTAAVPTDLPRAEAARALADELSRAGYAASTRDVGSGVQLCQHHCPVAHVATEFPELCEAEREAFAVLLGTPVQRLATIANGDPVCTTHVPAPPGGTGTPDDPPRSTQRPASTRRTTPGTTSGSTSSPHRTSHPRTKLRKETA